MVQSIHPDNDLHSLVSLLECFDSVLNFRSLQRIGELLRVDADNELVCADEAIFVLNLIRDLSPRSSVTQLILNQIKEADLHSQ